MPPPGPELTTTIMGLLDLEPVSAPTTFIKRERRVLKVAAAQIETRFGEVDANLKKHLDIIKRARDAGAHCLLFPEMSLTGHNAGGFSLDLAIQQRDPRIRMLAEASGDMWTLFGLIEEGFAAQFYNAVFAVKDGQLPFLHRKINLATYGRLEDGKHFATGRYVETFQLSDFWRASTLVCNDVWNPALVHLAALHGATVLFIPASSAREALGAGFDNPGGWNIVCRFYASMYGLPLVFANRVGNEQDLSFWGGSRILDAFGEVLASAENEEDLLFAEITEDAVRRARYLLPTVRDSNLGLIAREVNRLQDILGVPDAVRRY